MRIRIQGASNCELWREREIFFIIHTLLSHPDTEIELRNVEKNTVQGIKKFIQKKWMIRLIGIGSVLTLSILWF